MRKGLVCLLVIALAGLAFAAHGGSLMVSKTAVQRLDELNRILDEILEGLEAGALGLEELADRIEEAFTAFENVLAAMPVAGVLFSDVFGALYDIQYALNDAADIVDTRMAPSPYSLYLAFADARRAKDSLRWSASGGLIQKQLECAKGRALVMVYPGFDCYKLKGKLRELIDAGTCVSVAWREAEGYMPPPIAAFDYGPVAVRLYDCLGGAFQTSPTFEMRRDAEPGETGFTETYTFGDPTAAVHISQAPPARHPALMDSALASDVVRGAPTRIDPTHPLQIDDIVKPWYSIGELCSPVPIEWRYYDPAGSLVYSDASTLTPADYGSNCLSNYSSAGWTTLRGPAFGMGGTYAVELWFDDTYSALHRFTMSGAGPQPPIVNDDFYVMDEDFVLVVNDVLTDPPVLRNDGDPNPEPLQAKLQEGPHHGELDLNADGTFTYTPMTDFYGVDWYSYVAVDPGGLEGVGEVTILVNPIDDPPIANDDVYDIAISPDERTWTVSVPTLGWSETGTFVEDGVFIDIPAPGVLINDADPDGDPLLVVPGDTAPSWLTMSADGSLVIDIPDLSDVPESARLWYGVVDPGGHESTAGIEIRILLQEGRE